MTEIEFLARNTFTNGAKDQIWPAIRKGGHMFTRAHILKVRVSIPIILCGIILFWNFAALGEEWTEAQKEVWSVIEKRWEKIKEGDHNFVKAHTHDDAFIWFRG